MPLLGALLTSLFGSIAVFIAQFWAKKIAVAGLAVAAFAVALGVLMVVFNQLVTPFMAMMFQSQYGQFLGLAFPPIAGSCMASIGAAWAGCLLYKLKMQSIKMTASA